MTSISRKASRAHRARLSLETLTDRSVPVAGVLDGNFGTGGFIQTAFDLGPAGQRNDTAHAVASQPDGKVVVTGAAQRGATTADFALARYNRDGSFDVTFGGDGTVVLPFNLGGNSDDQARAVAVLPDGRVVVAGSAATTANGLDFAVARLNADGTPDTSFGGDGLVTFGFDLGGSRNDIVNDLLVYPDGKVVLAGSAAIAGGSDFAVVRLNADGTPDPTFAGDGTVSFGFDGTPTDAVAGVAFGLGGTIVVAGTATVDTNNSHVAVARLTAAGALDGTFDVDGRVVFDYGTTPGNHTGRDVAVQADGAIVVVGEAENTNTDLGIARLLPAGSFDFAFSGDGKLVQNVSNDGTREDSAAGVLVQPDGKIVVAGHSGRDTSGTGHTDMYGMRLNADGSPDSSYNGSSLRFYDVAATGVSDDRAFGVALTSDGIVIAGNTSTSAGLDFAVARIQRDDWVVVSAGPGGPPTVKVFTPTGTELFRFDAAPAAFRGGIRTAAGEVTGDTVTDLFTVSASAGPHTIKIWDGFTQQLIRAIPVLPGFRGGVTMAVGDVLGDTNVELLVAARRGRAPDVFVFDPRTGILIKTIRVFNDAFRGDVRLAVGNPLPGTPKEELVIGTGPATAPVVRIFDGDTGEMKSEIALAKTGLTRGYQLAVADVRNIGRDDIVITPGPLRPSTVRLIDTNTGTQVEEYTAFNPRLAGGLRLSAEEITGGGPDEIVVGSGPGVVGTVKVLRGDTGEVLNIFNPFGKLRVGLFVLGVQR